MIYTIKNQFLTIKIDSEGAQLSSINSNMTNTEYLWQGDEKYWTGRAYNLFPIIGRLFKNLYENNGELYHMTAHGFARKANFELVDSGDDFISLAITETEETYKTYPYKFVFTITYKLVGSTLNTTFSVKNNSENAMSFGIGGHPGFNIPFAGGQFEDYYLEFEKSVEPSQLLLSDNYLMSGIATKYPLEDGNTIPLKHNLFDYDAIILQNAGTSVSIKSNKTANSVKVTFENMPFVGIWHKPYTDAPYVCIEPWEILPGREGEIEVLEEKVGIHTIETGCEYHNNIEITIIEEK